MPGGRQTQAADVQSFSARVPVMVSLRDARVAKDLPPAGTDAAAGDLTLEGVLESVTFANEETGWSVVRLEVEGRRGPVTAVGLLPGVRPGECLRLTGRWETDRRFGEQFKFSGYLPVMPATLAGMERYLASGLIRGIGKVMAARLVKRFGLETMDVIERAPERLEEVEGIGPARTRADLRRLERAAGRAPGDAVPPVARGRHGARPPHLAAVRRRRDRDRARQPLPAGRGGLRHRFSHRRHHRPLARAADAGAAAAGGRADPRARRGRRVRRARLPAARRAGAAGRRAAPGRARAARARHRRSGPARARARRAAARQRGRRRPRPAGLSRAPLRGRDRRRRAARGDPRRRGRRHAPRRRGRAEALRGRVGDRARAPAARGGDAGAHGARARDHRRAGHRQDHDHQRHRADPRGRRRPHPALRPHRAGRQAHGGGHRAPGQDHPPAARVQPAPRRVRPQRRAPARGGPDHRRRDVDGRPAALRPPAQGDPGRRAG